MTEPLRVAGERGERMPLRELTIDMRSVKPAVLKEVEARLGEPLGVAGRKSREADIVWAFAYAVGRRLDPGLTWEEAGEIEVTLIREASVPPTGAGG